MATPELSVEERAAWQRERARRKQQAYRDRKKAAEIAAAKEEEEEESEEGEGGRQTSKRRKSSRNSRVGALREPSISEGGSSSGSDDMDDEVQWWEISELAEEAGQRRERSAGEGGAAGWRTTTSSWLIRPFPLSTRNTTTFAERRPEVDEPTPALLTAASLFTNLLGTFFPPSHQPIIPLEQPPIPLDWSTALRARQSPLLLDPYSNNYLPMAFPPPPNSQTTPAECFNQEFSDWKWSLFQLHRACHDHRYHPTEGYLHNQVAHDTVYQAQLLVLQLLGSSSPNKAFFDSRRVLSRQDEDFLTFAPMDPRLKWWPDPLTRILMQKASSAGVLNLTEMLGFSIELAVFWGDVWDSSSLEIPDSIWYQLPERLRSPDRPRRDGSRILRGATVREIVLGVEEPGWRSTTHVFPRWESEIWQVVEDGTSALFRGYNFQVVPRIESSARRRAQERLSAAKDSTEIERTRV